MNEKSMTRLGDAIFEDIDDNDFLNVLYDHMLYNYAIHKLHLEGFQQPRQVDVGAALRFADLLSKSTHPKKADDHKMWAQAIITLLLELEPNNEGVKYYAGSVLTGIGNFRGTEIAKTMYHSKYAEPSLQEKAFAAFMDEYLSVPAEEGKKWLQKELKDLKDDSYNEILGEPVNDQQGMKELSIFSQEKTPPMLIVEVPVKEPWQVIAWFPFGNWNACPEKKDLVNVCKYWYEKYGAVPSLITYDTLEMTVSKPVSNNQSLELAEEQYAFCTDIVSQGVGYVNTLADCLRKSTVWYFWWD